jgi:hypothetical protein
MRSPQGKSRVKKTPGNGSQGTKHNPTKRKHAMSIFAGIDLHSNNAVCGLVDGTGRRLERKKLPNEFL